MRSDGSPVPSASMNLYVVDYSEADAELPFVRDADEAVVIGGPKLQDKGNT